MSEVKIVRIRDVMSTHVNTIDGLATVAQALAKMKEQNTAVLIVDKRHENDEYGMLLINDIARQVLAKDRAPDRMNVYEVMTKPVVTVDPHMDIRYCARLFVNYDLVRAPVVENGRIIGIVSPFGLVMEGLYAMI